MKDKMRMSPNKPQRCTKALKCLPHCVFLFPNCCDLRFSFDVVADICWVCCSPSTIYVCIFVFVFVYLYYIIVYFHLCILFMNLYLCICICVFLYLRTCGEYVALWPPSIATNNLSYTLLLIIPRNIALCPFITLTKFVLKW